MKFKFLDDKKKEYIGRIILSYQDAKGTVIVILTDDGNVIHLTPSCLIGVADD